MKLILWIFVFLAIGAVVVDAPLDLDQEVFNSHYPLARVYVGQGGTRAGRGS